MTKARSSLAKRNRSSSRRAADVHALGRGRRVVVRDPRVERQALGALDRLGRDPGERGDESGVAGQPFCAHGLSLYRSDLG